MNDDLWREIVLDERDDEYKDEDLSLCIICGEKKVDCGGCALD